jgi:hypothetical protein
VLADGAAWDPRQLAEIAPAAANAAVKRMDARELWDWRAVLTAYGSLNPDMLRDSLER